MLGATVVALDVAGTFISPALAFSTAKATEGIAIGIRMLRRTWPPCAFYALCPPLALQVLATVGPSGQAVLAVSLAVATALVSLVFKGSTVASTCAMSRSVTAAPSRQSWRPTRL